MPRGLVIVLGAVLVAGVAAVEGLRSNRWGPSADMQAAVARLDRVPAGFGDWEGVDKPLDRKVVEVAEAQGIVSRHYTNRKTGASVSVLILCGSPGPIGAHTPDVCYGGLGYECVGVPVARQVAVGDGSATFWTARFEKTDRGAESLRVYWAWGVDGGWEAADDPRTRFALQPALYKLYVVERETAENADDPAAPEFLAEFLPLVKTALAPDAATTTDPPADAGSNG
jgi:hypothetical protein